ncbi:replication-associated recombination protein A [Nitratiruptor sp. YY09-18]|uniref:replication-associated recombination protein A n=1 Tax=Nitratiruptor sp. YY09-18 TaxID=2724901 RepID=UPI0019162996|nr:replication-associated recombination protein A [Nitratiruptor sp. YY09-18]BCD67199.1 ATPase, AAA family [Nitratiruptor sp. YY09-18]
MVDFRPQNIEEFVGQSHLVAPGALFRKLLENSSLPNSFFYGPPGTGKTTLARIVAKILEKEFYELNATSLKIDDMRKIIKQHASTLFRPLIFIDEVHRLSKTQQEVLLPIMENNEALILGASTENPFFSLTAAVRSRSLLFAFKPLNDEEIRTIARRVLDKLELKIEEEALEYLVRISQGDARNIIKFLQTLSVVSKNITLNLVKELAPSSYHDGVRSADTHYDLASALIKSMRGSDVDATLYYLARLIVAGEPPEFLARRMVIFASEDIGNANPQALLLATATIEAVKNIGYPEARIILAQCAVYLASSPKSNSSYLAINKAIAAVEAGEILPVPAHLKPPHFKGYKYPHDFGGYVEQEYMTKKMKLYESKGIGYEKRLDEWIAKIRGKESS